MRQEFRAQTPRTTDAGHALRCTCSPIRWATPALEDADPVDLPCAAFGSRPGPVVAVPRPRFARQVSTWDWTRSDRRSPQAA